MIKQAIKKIVPNKFWRLLQSVKNKRQSTEAIFTNIYEKKLWGEAADGRKYCSGEGTIDENVTQYIEVLQQFIQQKNIHRIFEIGCGDFSIMSKVLSTHPTVAYTGADIVKPVIDHLNNQPINEQLQFIHMNAVEHDQYPPADLCIIRQVLQHLSNQQILSILQKIKQYRYVLITEHVPLHPSIKNGDKQANGYIRLQNKQTSGIFLEASPFSLNCKTLLSYRYDDVNYQNKSVAGLMLTQLVEFE